VQIDVRTRGSVIVLDVSGRMVGGEVGTRLHDELAKLLEVGEPLLVLNLRGVGVIDSEGLGELIACRERVRHGGGVVKLLPTGPIRDLMDASGLSSLFQVYDDEDAALDSFSASCETAGIP
jgi:anti-anti-sigma factor